MTLQKKLWGWLLIGVAGLSLVGLWFGWPNAPLSPSDLSAETFSDLMFLVGWIVVVVAVICGCNDLGQLLESRQPKKEFSGAGVLDEDAIGRHAVEEAPCLVAAIGPD